MGTNYYLEPEPPCEGCKRPFERLHIGKSSGGWCFSLHVDPDAGINDLPDWQDRWSRPNARIVNEYGDVVPAVEMLAIILSREGFAARDSVRSAQFLDENHAEPGPHGLLRHRIGRHCSGHGGGTYDLIPGEFS